MTSEKQIRSVKKYNGLVILLILIVGMAIYGFPVVAAVNGVPEISDWNPYTGWDLDLLSEAGINILPTGDVNWTEEPDEALLNPDSTDNHWVKLSYFPAGSAAGQPAILSGYVGGNYYNADVTIAGKKNSSDIFHDIITVRPQENGVFVWAIPNNLAIVQFYQATATVGGTQAKSEIVSTSVINKAKPVSTNSTTAVAATSVASPAPTQVSTASSVASSVPTQVSTASSLPVSTSLTLSADNLRPAVGQEVILSGRLTANGKGVSGKTITIEVPDYGTDFLPLISTQTDSDGRFSATINTTEGGVVPVQAVFEGDDKFMSSTSNTLTFTAGNSSFSGTGFF